MTTSEEFEELANRWARQLERAGMRFRVLLDTAEAQTRMRIARTMGQTIIELEKMRRAIVEY